MRKLLFILILFLSTGCELYETNVFTGYPPSSNINDPILNVKGAWKLSMGYRVEKISTRESGVFKRDSTIFIFQKNVKYNVFKVPSELNIDNIIVNNTVWVFDSNYLYLNSLDRYDYIIYNNKVIDITIPPTKRVYTILELTNNKLSIRSGEKYNLSNNDYKTESSYSVLEFTK